MARAKLLTTAIENPPSLRLNNSRQITLCTRTPKFRQIAAPDYLLGAAADRLPPLLRRTVRRNLCC